MTILRRLAQKIAGFVVRHASPPSKQWAEGLAREGDFIESDWKALRWAFGSGRVLFDYYVPRPGWTLDDLTVAAEKFAEQKRHQVNDFWLTRHVRWLPLFFGSIGQIAIVHLARNGKECLGDGMVMIGFLIIAIFMFFQSREPVVPDRDDISSIIRFYAACLKSASSRSSIAFWVFSCIFISIGFGLQAKPLFAVVWLGMLGLTLHIHRKHRMRWRLVEPLLDSGPLER